MKKNILLCSLFLSSFCLTEETTSSTESISCELTIPSEQKENTHWKSFLSSFADNIEETEKENFISKCNSCQRIKILFEIQKNNDGNCSVFEEIKKYCQQIEFLKNKSQDEMFLPTCLNCFAYILKLKETDADNSISGCFSIIVEIDETGYDADDESDDEQKKETLPQSFSETTPNSSETLT
ncbi:hypothetical protein HYV11_03310 [Candidatus Dependentiae bacterium]|nr:hypothetical protein [Candidatus Dependentiae bacterium]